ncbi:MAG: HAD family hydrolase [archaeon]
MRKKELICLDMDNTLVRSNKVHMIAFVDSFKKNNLPKRTRKEIMEVFSLPGEIMVKRLYPHLTHKRIKDIVDDHDEFVIKETYKYAKRIPGVLNALKLLKKKYKIVIVTNCKHKEIRPILKGAGIERKYFDRVIGNDDVKNGKPKPDEIFKAEKLMHVKSAIMVGDAIYDVMAARRANVKCFAVLTGNHSRKELMKEKPYKILRSVKYLPKHL